MTMSPVNASKLYDAYYFQHGCGLPYNYQEEHWGHFFGGIADRIITEVQPASVLDAGCALGFLVYALRLRGTEAYGIDVSDFAIQNVHATIKPFCRVRSVTEPLPRRYDLIVCIEVLEHLQPPDAEAAVANFCQHADDILFSSSPDDFKEATHFNVRPPEDWAELFARHGFYRDVEFDGTFITPWAVRFRKSRQPVTRVIKSYERRLWHLERQIGGSRELTIEQRAQLAEREQAGRALAEDLAAKTQALEQLSEEHNRLVSALAHEVPARRQAIQEITEDRDKTVQELSDRLSERGRAVEALLSDLKAERQRRTEAEQELRRLEVERELAYQNLQREIDGRAQLVQALGETKERAVRALCEELQEKDRLLAFAVQDKDQAILTLRQQVAQIQLSRSWRMVLALRAAGKALLPPASPQARAARLAARGFRVWRRDGVRALARKVYRKGAERLRRRWSVQPANLAPTPGVPREGLVRTDPANATYAQWIEENEPNAKELTRQRQTALPYAPKISVVVPVYNTPVPFLVSMLHSVLEQTYSNWELCIADGASTEPAVRATLEGYARRDSRIRLRFLTENLGIAGNSNAAIGLATGDYVTLLDHDDTLAPFALYEVAQALNCQPGADLLYSDEDKVTEDGDRRMDPHFKPDWSPDTFRSHNFICHLAVFQRELVTRIGGFSAGYEGSQDYDLFLRATEQAAKIVHIPKVLYHWRIHGGSAAAGSQAKGYAYESAKKAIREHLIRRNIRGEVKDGKILGIYQVAYELPCRPLVSVIIPNRDNALVLDQCLRSLAASTYAHHEVVVVENNSQNAETFGYYTRIQKQPNIKVVTWQGSFNYSAVNNFAVAHSQGEVLLFLNNDIEAINPDWLERMLEHALRPDVGAVGAKLYYPNDTIQHAGVILGLGGIAGHSHHWIGRAHTGYLGRLLYIQNVSAVTAACLMMRRAVFDEVGGFDERFPLAFNDVDLCVKVRRKGHHIIWTPYAELYHHESLTRGKDDAPDKRARFRREVALFAEKWPEVLQAGDPFYNPNLTLLRPDFALKLADERRTNLLGWLAEPEPGQQAA
jgi:GT2 family glycosyltransferase/SAM-dependent methyltransferase